MSRAFDREGTCACGLWAPEEPDGRDPYTTGLRRTHQAHHRRWAQGQPVSPAARRAGLPSDGLLLVRADAAAPLMRLVWEQARTFQRLKGYDFAAWPRHAARRWAYWTVEETLADNQAILWLAGGVLLGHVTTRRRTHCVRWDPAARRVLGEEPVLGATGPGPDTTTRRRSVDTIFVCHDAQRQGIATRLVQAVADAERVAVADLAWGCPLSEAGLALATALAVTPEQPWLWVH